MIMESYIVGILAITSIIIFDYNAQNWLQVSLIFQLYNNNNEISFGNAKYQQVKQNNNDET